MAEHDRPAGGGRYSWRGRHGRDDGAIDVNWAALTLVAAVLVAIGAAIYIGVRIGGGDSGPADIALPVQPSAAPGGFPSVAVSIAPAPSVTASYSAPAFHSAPASASVPASASASARPPRPSAGRTRAPAWEQKVIAATSVLEAGQSWSTNRLRLTLTGGGNLELRDQGKVVWQTGTTTGVKLVMQNDGHLVLYDAANRNVWSSETAGNPGAVLILRADGTMVISLNGRVLFRTGTGD